MRQEGTAVSHRVEARSLGRLGRGAPAGGSASPAGFSSGGRTLEERRAARFVTVLPIVHRVDGDPTWQRGITINVSESGLLLEAAKPIPLGTTLQLGFELEGLLGRFDAGPVTCEGRVVRPAEPTGPVPHPTGIQFLEPGEQQASASTYKSA